MTLFELTSSLGTEFNVPKSVPKCGDVPILSPICPQFCPQFGKRFWGHNWGHFIPSLNWVYIVIYRHHILSGTGWGDWGRPHIWGRIWGQDGDRISVAGDRKNCPWGRNPLTLFELSSVPGHHCMWVVCV